MAHNVYQEEVDISVVVDGNEFFPTSVETEMYARGNSNHCLITGLLPNGTVPRPGQDITIDINGYRVFTGYAVRGARNKESLYVIEGYSTRYGLARLTGTITTQDGKMFNVKAFEHEMEHANVPSYDYDVGGTYSGSGVPTTHEYANKNLINIIDDISNRLNAYWWVDETGKVILSNDIRSGGGEITYMKDAEIGDQSSTKDETVVFGGSPGSDSGTEYATMVLEGKLKGEETKESEEEQYGGNFSTLFKSNRKEQHKKKNMQSQNEVNAAAKSFMEEHYEDTKYGTIKTAGQENVYPWQKITVPSYPETADVAEGDYIARAVKHRMNEQDGFITNIDIMSTKGKNV